MNRAAMTVTATVAALLLGTGGLLEFLKRNQRLSEPGVRLVAVPVLDENGERVRDESVDLPASVSGYRSTKLPMARIVLDWLPPDTQYGHRLYEAEDGFWIQSGAVLMGADRTSIHQPQYCLTGQGFQIVEERKASIRIGGESGYDLPVRRLTARGTFRGADGKAVELTRLLVYWFVADGSITADHEQRMWEQALVQLRTGELQRWAYITCFAPCSPDDVDDVFRRVAAFVADFAPGFMAVGPHR
jgi:hypothetical protein